MERKKKMIKLSKRGKERHHKREKKMKDKR